MERPVNNIREYLGYATVIKTYKKVGNSYKIISSILIPFNDLDYVYHCAKKSKRDNSRGYITIICIKRPNEDIDDHNECINVINKRNKKRYCYNSENFYTIFSPYLRRKWSRLRAAKKGLRTRQMNARQ